MPSHTITLTLSTEDRALLLRLAEAIERRSDSPETSPAPETANEPTAEPVTAVAPAEPDPEPQTAVTREQVQQTVLAMLSGTTDAVKKSNIRNIVRRYADRVSAIPEDKLAACLADLQKEA